VTRVLITGATGFIGRHCLERLCESGGEIHAVTRTLPQPAAGPARWHAADLRDPAAARNLIETVRPDHLLHLAWEATPRLYAGPPENLRWLIGATAMLTAFGEYGGQRFVGAGSLAEYAGGQEVCAEDETPIRPATVYGKCKAACWLAAQAAAQHYRFDAADLPVRLLFSQETGVFNVATGRATPVGAVVAYLADRLGGRGLLRVGTLEPPPDEPAALIADMTKVQARLGWSAPTSIEAGLVCLLLPSMP
jgi:nucleoside-diphosphate-sugar epimerase